MPHRLAVLRHALPLIESLNEGLHELETWVKAGEQLVEGGRRSSVSNIQLYADNLQVED